MDTDVAADLLIIGAGPAGLYAAYYAGFRGLTVAVMDSLPEPGGQVTAMYPEKQIFDVAGFPSIKGRDLVAALVEQANVFKPQYLLGQQAAELAYDEQGLPVITSAQGTRVHTKAVLITGGLGTFTPRPLPAGTEWLGRGLSYFVTSLQEHAGRDVVVVGGGDSAFDWALALAPIANSVTLVHRRDKFRAHEATVRKVAELGVPIHTWSEIATISGTDGVESCEVHNVKTEERTLLPATTVIAALGFTADLGPLTRWGLEIDKRHIVVSTTMATNQPRIFSAGDITEYPGKVRLIATGFGEAATAVNNAAVTIDPGAHLFPGHSSEG
jgi:thioredoxin reductase (NADPH)